MRNIQTEVHSLAPIAGRDAICDTRHEFLVGDIHTVKSSGRHVDVNALAAFGLEALGGA